MRKGLDWVVIRHLPQNRERPKGVVRCLLQFDFQCLLCRKLTLRFRKQETEKCPKPTYELFVKTDN